MVVPARLAPPVDSRLAPRRDSRVARGLLEELRAEAHEVDGGSTPCAARSGSLATSDPDARWTAATGVDTAADPEAVERR